MFSPAALRLPAPVRVWMYSPSERPDTLPLVIMMHGAERNAEGYLNQWMPVADLFNLVVIAPEFDKENYTGGEKYNLGNVREGKGGFFKSEKEWTFSVPEPLFDFVKDGLGSDQIQYFLSGHSAGSQFVHRFLYFVPQNRAAKVFMANAGWYTLPDLTTNYPFGISDIPNASKSLNEFFMKPVFVVLGEADVDTTSENFQKGPVYNKQGLNRFERGNNFFQVAQRTARQNKIPFNWTLITLPGVAHSNAETAKQAGAIFRSTHYPQY